MGHIDPAFICYRKSAICLQDQSDHHIENQGFVRKWVGELLLVKGEFCSAKAFLEAAKHKWEIVCPARVPLIDETLLRISNQTAACPKQAELCCHLVTRDLSRKMRTDFGISVRTYGRPFR